MFKCLWISKEINENKQITCTIGILFQEVQFIIINSFNIDITGTSKMAFMAEQRVVVHNF